MKVVHGAPPSYREEMAKMDIRSNRARDHLANGFPVAIDSHSDYSRDARIYTVCTPYCERSLMTLTGTDLPRRTSNMCPVVQDEMLLQREPLTPSELLGQFFLDPTRVTTYVKKRGIESYDYANKALNDIESLPGGYVGNNSDSLSNFDCMQRTATAVFSYDIATPRIGPGCADAVIITGDLAHVWQWCRLAKLPLQESLEEVFCDAIGAKPKGSFEERLGSSMKRIRDVPLFHVTDVAAQGLDFTQMTRLMVVTMSSIPCILRDAFLKQINTVLSSVYPLKEEPTVPTSIFHDVCEQYRDGCGDDQVATLKNLVKGYYRHFNNVMKIVRESKQRLADSISYHRHLACSTCGQDATGMFSIRQEVNDPTLSHCGATIHNAGKFVTIQTKANRRTYSLECSRQVRIMCKGLPQYGKGNNEIGIFTDDQAKRIFERPCVISDRLRPMMLPDIGNQRGKYDNVSSTVYVLVPFDRQATLERLRADGVEDPQADLLTLYNVVECIVPIYSSSGGLVEYRFEALAFRGKSTISVQAYGKTPMGEIALFDPEATTKRLSIEMLTDDGKVKLHQYRHQLEYNQKRYFQTQGTMLSITNFKQYKSTSSGDATKPMQERTNWDEYGYTLVGAMAANLPRCAQYAGQPLVPPERLQFGVVSDTREQDEKRAREHKKRKRETESQSVREAEIAGEMERLRCALEEERQRTSRLSSDLTVANAMLELNEMSSQKDKKKIEQLTGMKEAVEQQCSALKTAKDDQIKDLEARLDSCLAELQEAKKRKKHKRKNGGQGKTHLHELGVSWLPECGVSVLAV